MLISVLTYFFLRPKCLPTFFFFLFRFYPSNDDKDLGFLFSVFLPVFRFAAWEEVRGCWIGSMGRRHANFWRDMVLLLYLIPFCWES